ncbi:relaxase family protein [Paenirhodobacter populi]|uniref:relaxase/mobilization nuclease domain-containing protein n=1 Tax=Paenirhodobacter populi TaxID=2306993 RepID=UPI000FE40865|nr:relaxase/mobilization nuclease domain-containing protein [Sinirhodobacter populi]RWR04523.1 mobilization relaxase [Sinirhodobacter populi]
MLIQFFPNGKGTGAGPVGYLIATTVLAYDDNRDLRRDDHGTPLTVTRDPRPEVVRGDPTRTEALIDACPHQWTYRAGVISFTREDAPDDHQQAEVMDRFEELAFAGLDRDQYDCLWVRHTHEDRVELHFYTPRMELSTGKSLNIAPPGYQTAFDSLRDVMNKTHSWADPLDADRAQAVREQPEAPTRAQGREELHSWIIDQISIGAMHDRGSMAEVLREVDYELPRLGKDYLTVKGPETGERWRLKGEIFREGWQAPTAAPQREAEHRSGQDQGRERRLDGVTAGDLQERFADHCERRTDYNRGRYQGISELERHALAQSSQRDHAGDLAQALDAVGRDDLADRRAGLRDLGVERRDRGHAPADGLGGGGDAAAPRSERHLPDPRSDADHRDQMQPAGPRSALFPGGGLNDGRSDDPVGARIGGLRREVGRVLRGLGEGVARFGAALDHAAGGNAEWLTRLRGAAHAFANAADAIARLAADRVRDLRAAGREVDHERAAAGGRRSEVEAALKERNRERDRGASHGF